MKARIPARMRKARMDGARAAEQYDSLVTPGAESIQDLLVRLIGTDGANAAPGRGSTIRNEISRMAASDPMLNLLKAMPAAGALYGTAAVGDVVAGEETFANKGMDMLGMGVGAFGINRGVNALGGTTPAGKALAYMAAAGLGKMGSDAAQGVIGG